MRHSVDGRSGWIVVACAFCVYSFSVGMHFVTGIFYRAWLKSDVFAHTTPSSLSMAISIEGALVLLGALIAGKLIVLTNAYVTIAVGSMLILLGTLTATFIELSEPSSALAVLYVCFGVLMGAGIAIVHITAVIAVQSFFVKRRGLATGLTVAGSGVGGLVLGPLMEYLVNRMGWRQALAIYGACTAAICLVSSAVIGLVTLRDERLAGKAAAVRRAAAESIPGESHLGDSMTATTESQPETPVATPVPLMTNRRDSDVDRSQASEDEAQIENSAIDVMTAAREEEGAGSAQAAGQKSDSSSSAAEAVVSTPTYRDLARTRFFWTYTCYITFFATCWFTAPTFLPITITEQLGGTSADVSIVTAVQGVANTCGRILIGILTDRFPAHKLTLLSGAMFVAAAASLGFSLSSQLGYAYVYGAILGGFGGSVLSVQPGIVIDSLGMRFLPIAQGALNAVQAPFALAGPPIGGAIRVSTGNYAGTWGFIAGCYLIAWLFTLNIAGAAAAAGKGGRGSSSSEGKELERPKAG